MDTICSTQCYTKKQKKDLMMSAFEIITTWYSFESFLDRIKFKTMLFEYTAIRAYPKIMVISILDKNDLCNIRFTCPILAKWIDPKLYIQQKNRFLTTKYYYPRSFFYTEQLIHEDLTFGTHIDIDDTVNKDFHTEEHCIKNTISTLLIYKKYTAAKKLYSKIPRLNNDMYSQILRLVYDDSKIVIDNLFKMVKNLQNTLDSYVYLHYFLDVLLYVCTNEEKIYFFENLPPTSFLKINSELMMHRIIDNLKNIKDIVAFFNATMTLNKLQYIGKNSDNDSDNTFYSSQIEIISFFLGKINKKDKTDIHYFGTHTQHDIVSLLNDVIKYLNK